jgi:mannitol 2-dehydrogenase
MRKLAQSTLKNLRQDIPVPQYDRSSLATGIVHFGVGGFHRAHQAMMVDSLLNEGKARDFGICGVGVLSGDRRMHEVLTRQDGLYTLVVKHADGRWEPRVIGSIVKYLFAPDDPEAVIEKLASESTRIVSLTITEGGYNVDPFTGIFSTEGLVDDLKPGAVPTTVFGFVTEALRRRRDRSIEPFTVLSCDNVQNNGRIAAKAFTSFAHLKDPELADWITLTVSFPNTMVDRITPVTTDTDRREIRARFGIDDEWPVVCEPFSQWVIEDDFTLGRPPYEDAGAQIVEDVEPYELMKLRLLNASHQAMAYFGYLAGYRYAHEAMSDPLLASLLTQYMDQEATPTLRPVPGIDLAVYKRSLIERFSNSEVRDTLARLCVDSSDRITKFVLPVIRERLAAGHQTPLAAAIVASWARYAEGVDENGEAIQVVDRMRDQLIKRAQEQRINPRALLEERSVFGDLADDPRFVSSFLDTLAMLHDFGSWHTYARLVDEHMRR